MPVTFVLSRFSEEKKGLLGGGLRGRGGGQRGRTFRGIRGLVVLCEPLQVLVLHPGDPVVVLAVVELAGLLLVRLALGGLFVRHDMYLCLNSRRNRLSFRKVQVFV